jgi:polyhydroxyalkanoate synthase
MTRLGPRPLPAHLMLAGTLWTSAFAASPLSKPDSTGWSAMAAMLPPPLRTAFHGLADHPADAVARALTAEIARRAERFLDGLVAYRRHPYRRTLPDPPTLWSEGTTRLLDYGPEDGTPVLVVPSLVNRAYILDLMAERSLMRWLSGRGIRPFLVEWGAPDAAERHFTLTDLVAGRLERALDAVRKADRRRPALIGYCMGGTLAVALAQRRADDLAGVALLAAPWDFGAGQPQSSAVGRLAAVLLEPLIATAGVLPVDAIQLLFVTLDPVGGLRKFSGFAATAPDSAEAERFVALEDWLNDGIPIPGPVARECLGGWYGDNTPAAGRWLIAGLPVAPAAIPAPSLHIIPARDRIVPPASAAALAGAMRGADRIDPPLGHVGMMTSHAAMAVVWQPLAEWLLARAEPANPVAAAGRSGDTGRLRIVCPVPIVRTEDDAAEGASRRKRTIEETP